MTTLREYVSNIPLSLLECYALSGVFKWHVGVWRCSCWWSDAMVAIIHIQVVTMFAHMQQRFATIGARLGSIEKSSCGPHRLVSSLSLRSTFKNIKINGLTRAVHLLVVGSCSGIGNDNGGNQVIAPATYDFDPGAAQPPTPTRTPVSS